MKTLIEKPIIALVVGLLILLIGFLSLFQLSVREFPKLDISAITINTDYPGASAKQIQSFVTQPLEQSIANVDGIDHISASSSDGSSSIIVFVKLNYDADNVLLNIISQVDSIQYLLPNGVQNPSILKQTGVTFPSLIVSFTSNAMSAEKISAYLSNVVKPALQNIQGISYINIFGNKPYALRVWLNPVKMFAHNITAEDVNNALLNNNVVTSAGILKTTYTKSTVNVTTNLKDEKEFSNLIVADHSGHQILLKDIATVELGTEDYNTSFIFNGKNAVNLTFMLQTEANPITVINQIKKRLPMIEQSFPPGLNAEIAYDSTTYIQSSLHEVLKTLIEAIVIVTIVVFLFLGSLRLALIPIIAIPLSLLGACSLVYLFGFSINTLTLLAMVLAIGLVVDDAIVVLENIHRVFLEKNSIFEASIVGIQQVLVPIITMSLTLAIVFLPVGFIGGLTTALFKEFAFTLALTVIVSGVVAIILTPTLCSSVMESSTLGSKFHQYMQKIIEKTQCKYIFILKFLFRNKFLAVLFYFGVIIATIFLIFNLPRNLSPQEDQSYLGLAGYVPSNTNLNYLKQNDSYLQNIYKNIPGVKDYFIVNGSFQSNNISSGIILSPPSERKNSQMDLANFLQMQMSSVPGIQAFVYQIPTLPIAGDGVPIEFVITSTLDHKKIYETAESLALQADKSGLFMFIKPDLTFDNSQFNINVDRKKAADLGISMEDINQTLSILWSNNYINFFDYEGSVYQVIPQVEERFRKNTDSLNWVYIRGNNSKLISLSQIATANYTPEPAVLEQFQQMNSVTLQGILAPGVSLGDGLSYLEKLSNQILPPQMHYDFDGQSRAFMQESNQIFYLIGFAVLLIYLLLMLQFQKWKEPLVIMMTVPLSVFGALLAMLCWGVTINIFTEIGLLTLIGLITKHGILIVDCTLNFFKQGNSREESILLAARQRLRPILMTTTAMMGGAFPLMLARGAGSNSRFDLGITIFFGMLIGTIFTLFIIPVGLLLLEKSKSSFLKKTSIKVNNHI